MQLCRLNVIGAGPGGFNDRGGGFNESRSFRFLTINEGVEGVLGVALVGLGGTAGLTEGYEVSVFLRRE